MHEKLNIRLANINDMKNVFELSNDDVVRKNSIHKEKIEWENHVNWFENRIKNNFFYIIETLNNNFIAQVRIDQGDENTISISICEKYRGKKLASYIIKKCSEKSKLKNITAYISINNIASKKAFEKAGYITLPGIIKIDNEPYYKLLFKENND